MPAYLNNQLIIIIITNKIILLLKLTFDGSLKGLGYSDHNIRAKHPEDVVHKQSTKQYTTSYHFVQVKEFYTVDGESYAEQVVGDPVL